MFESMYKTRKKRWINYFGFALFAFICLMFVFTGYSPDVSFLGNPSVVAQVDGESIGLNDFNRVFERQQEQQKNKKLTSEERARLQKETIDLLVQRAMVLNLAKRQSITVAPAEIADFLMQVPQFQEDGKFSLIRYKELLRGQGMSESFFEQNIADDLIVQKMNTFYQQATHEDDWLEAHDEAIGKTTLNLSYARWPSAKFVQNAEVSDAEVAEYAKKHEAELKKEYEKLKATVYNEAEQVKAQHILIKTSPQMPEDKALAKIKQVAAEIQGENFADLAKKYSEDPGSKANGGDLGFFTRGRMVKEFEETAFTLAPGKVSEPVKTSYGYHIIKVNDKKPARQVPFDEAKLKMAMQKAKDEKLANGVNTFRDQVAKASDAEVMELVTKQGGTWEDTGAFTLNDMAIPKIGGSLLESDSLLAAASKLSEKHPVSKDVVEKDGFVYVFRYKPADGSKSNSAAPQMAGADFFKKLMARQEAMEMYNSWMAQLRQESSVQINDKLLGLN